LADYIQIPKEKLGENYRATHYNDPVPRLPPAIMGYAHYTPEYYIGAKNQKAVTLTDILMLDNLTTPKGNEQFQILDVEAHRWYFNAISACYVANAPSNGTSTAVDLATNWAGSVIGRMGNNTSLILINSVSASAMAGLIASMSTSAAISFLNMIPGGFLVIPFLPKPSVTGGLTAASMAGLLSSLESFYGSSGKPSGSSLIIDTQS
jgi:hypothetical protein